MKYLLIASITFLISSFSWAGANDTAAPAANFPQTLDCNSSELGQLQFEVNSLTSGALFLPPENGIEKKLLLTNLISASDITTTTLSYQFAGDTWIGISFNNDELTHLSINGKVNLQIIETDPGQPAAKTPAVCTRLK